MSAAQQVIAKFGSQAELARLTGKRPGTIQHWTKTGVIPAKWHSRLLALADELGINLSPSDFLEVFEEPATDDRLPVARWPGVLPIGGSELDVYVLDDGRRVITRTGATRMLIGRQGGGKLEGYLGTQVLREYLPTDWEEQLVQFVLPQVTNKTVLGMSAELFLDICGAYVRAWSDGALKSSHQQGVAARASMFLAACAKTGLIALIDEATGYQYAREENALQFKLRLFLEDEMRKWEKTFPDELWQEFGRLTRWRGSVNSRPKYWGQLVMELVYGYLDPDVTRWLRENAPKPQKGQNYHQYLSSQYGLKKLVEHLWMLIGMARACDSLHELKQRMAEQFGRTPIQLTLWVPERPPSQLLSFSNPDSEIPGNQMAPEQVSLALV
jgi:hypothetical protein